MAPSSLVEALRTLWPLLAQETAAKDVTCIAIAGGLAVSYWGHPRSTRDIDLAIMVGDYKALESRLLKGGLHKAVNKHHTSMHSLDVYQWRMPLPNQYIEVEIDFLVSTSEFHSTLLQRSITCTIFDFDFSVRVVTCEDLLLLKALAGRMIDLADIEAIQQLQGASLDRAYIAMWARELGLHLRGF
jgi:Nucleotidyl transferase AbiEii toxin, Type IV TA system